MKKSVAGIIIVIIIIIGLYNYINLYPDNYHSQPIAIGIISESIYGKGQLSLADEINIGAQVSGQITLISVKAGDYVNKDDILVEIDPTLQKNELKKSQSNLNIIDAQITYKNQQIAIKKNQVERKNIIYKLDGISREEIDLLTLELNELESEYNILQSQRVQSLLERDNAQANLDYTVIKAPASGMVLKTFTNVGQTIISSQASPTLLVIGNPENMLVNVQVSETDINKIHEGLTLKYSLTSYPEKEYSAIVETIDFLPAMSAGDKESYSSLQSNSPVYYNVGFRVKNDDRFFMPGLSVKVRFIINEKKDVITVPNSYIVSDKKTLEHWVYILKNNKPFKKKITPGISDGFKSEIVFGLNIGERLIAPIRDHSNPEGIE